MTHLVVVQVHPTVQTWTRWAKFEEKIGDIEMARQVYQNAIDYLGEEANDQELFIAFAQLEINNNEVPSSFIEAPILMKLW